MKQSTFIKGGELWIINEDGKREFYPAQSLHQYWRNPEDGENNPTDYKSCEDRSIKLVSIFDQFCFKDDKILELGCNVGRNLHHLYFAGYKNLSGVDINTNALKLAKTTYPDTVGKIKLYASPIEDFVLDIPEDGFDVVFTMAVLMHIHPSSLWCLCSLPSMAKKYLITAETENMTNWRVFKRDYKGIFEAMGLKQVFEENVKYPNLIDKTGEVDLTYRVFKK